jgi:hypothetical protein
LETDATRMCALLVGLPDVVVVGVGEWPKLLRIVIANEVDRPSCCGRSAHRHGVREMVLVDLPVFGRPARLGWRKQRWRCPICRRCWCDEDPQIEVGQTHQARRVGLVNLPHHRVRCLLYAGKPDWALLEVAPVRRTGWLCGDAVAVAVEHSFELDG